MLINCLNNYYRVLACVLILLWGCGEEDSIAPNDGFSGIPPLLEDAPAPWQQERTAQLAHTIVRAALEEERSFAWTGSTEGKKSVSKATTAREDILEGNKKNTTKKPGLLRKAMAKEPRKTKVKQGIHLMSSLPSGIYYFKKGSELYKLKKGQGQGAIVQGKVTVLNTKDKDITLLSGREQRKISIKAGKKVVFEAGEEDALFYLKQKQCARFISE